MADWGDIAQLGIQGAGEVAAGIQRGDAARLLEQARARYGDLPLPVLQRIVAQQLSSDEGAVAGDPSMIAAQQAALSRLGQVADDGGYSLESQAVQNRIRGDTARHESAGRNQIRNSMAARGVGGSGAELAMQLQGNQASAERVSQEGMTAAGQAQSAALRAMMGQGELAGRMRGQSFQEQSSAARARDMMRKFNAGASQRAAEYNNQQAQNQFNNQYRLAGGQAGIEGVQSQNGRADAKDTREAAGGYGYFANEMLKDPNAGQIDYGSDQYGGAPRGPVPDYAPAFDEDDWDEWA